MTQKELIFAWLDDLRTPGLKQVKGALGRPGLGHCCLGRACVVAANAGVPVVAAEDMDESGGAIMSFGGAAGELPQIVADSLGLDTLGDYDGSDGDGRPNSLAGDNDSNGLTFPEIADIIEANALTLFDNGEEVAGWIAERKASSPR